MDSESVGYYLLLCNLYSAVGRWYGVASVRKIMSENGLTVDPGCSWVEVKGSVHAFLSGDESHPQIKEIKGVLEGLDERMKKAGSEILGKQISFRREITVRDTEQFHNFKDGICSCGDEGYWRKLSE
ncbi:hypothetical protein MKW92_030594 [Papaver armeniacum]|nr:hypothetical protein MKW92_030594 [Papaver armeniacum]